MEIPPHVRSLEFLSVATVDNEAAQDIVRVPQPGQLSSSDDQLHNKLYRQCSLSRLNEAR